MPNRRPSIVLANDRKGRGGCVSFRNEYHFMTTNMSNMTADDLYHEQYKYVWHHDIETFSALLTLYWGEPIIQWWLPSERVSHAELWCFGPAHPYRKRALETSGSPKTDSYSTTTIYHGSHTLSETKFKDFLRTFHGQNYFFKHYGIAI